MGLQKKIAYRLRTLREAAGLSQQDVAQRAELSLSLIAKMEQGRKADPRASTLIAIASALGVRAGQLIEDLEKPPPGAFKGKKGKKKKQVLAAVGAPEGEAALAPAHDPLPDASADATNGDPAALEEPPAPAKRKRKKPE